jgi:hypothetical protein
MNSPTGNQGKVSDSQTDTGGINMSSLCRTLARVLVNLDEGEYTEEVRQDTVYQHDVSPDQASEASTREAK